MSQASCCVIVRKYITRNNIYMLDPSSKSIFLWTLDPCRVLPRHPPKQPGFTNQGFTRSQTNEHGPWIAQGISEKNRRSEITKPCVSTCSGSQKGPSSDTKHNMRRQHQQHPGTFTNRGRVLGGVKGKLNGNRNAFRRVSKEHPNHQNHPNLSTEFSRQPNRNHRLRGPAISRDKKNACHADCHALRFNQYGFWLPHTKI